MSSPGHRCWWMSIAAESTGRETRGRTVVGAGWTAAIAFRSVDPGCAGSGQRTRRFADHRIDGPGGSSGSSRRISARAVDRGGTRVTTGRAAPGISGSAATQSAGNAGQVDVPPGVAPQGMVTVRMAGVSRPANTGIHDLGVGHGPCFPREIAALRRRTVFTNRGCRLVPLMVAEDQVRLLEKCAACLLYTS